MNMQTTIRGLDRLQRKHGFISFVIAVIKQYADDRAGYQAALLTYYSYLALFPLLLIVVTMAQIASYSHPDLQTKIIQATASYFPVLGDQLSSHLSSLHKSGVALLIGLVVLLYGARGLAASLQRGVNYLWRIPRKQQTMFPASLVKHIVIIGVGGVGFILAAGLAAAVTAHGHGWDLRLLSLAVNVSMLYLVFLFLFKYSLPGRVRWQDVQLAAITAAIGIMLLQLLGGYILTRTLKHLDALYSYFAVSLGLLFWLYLQAQVVYYAVEIAVVRNNKAWPRSLDAGQPTAADNWAEAHRLER